VTYPQTAEIGCRDGYTVGGSPKGKSSFLIKCTKAGKFATYDARTCEPIKCGKAPALANAKLTEIKGKTADGPLKTNWDDLCLDYNYNNRNVYMHKCHKGKNQHFSFDKSGRLSTKHDTKCLDYNYNNKNVYMHDCHKGKNQKWHFDGQGRLLTRHDCFCVLFSCSGDFDAFSYVPLL
jgi:hypothetical protein